MTVDRLLGVWWQASDRYRRLPTRVLVAVRVGMVVAACAVLGTFEGLINGTPR